MISLLALFLCSFVLSFILTPVCRDLALRAGLVDSPDQKRKLHAHPIPRVGGVPIMAACLFSVLALVACGSAAGGMVVRALPSIAGLLPAVLVIFAVGLLDDLIGLKPRYKLAGQVVAAGLACSAGVRIHSLGGHAIQNWWAIPLTVFWLVGCTNAVNLIDGVDGLAAGVGLVATLTTLMAGLLQGNFALALATVTLAGALCGFLRYNFNPASIFLGDCGSLLIGFLLGAYGLIWSQKSTTLIGMTAPMMALAIPLLDTGLAIVRRALRGQPIFGADRRHIHHLLLDRGFSPRRVALLLYGVCGLAATLSLLLNLAHGQYAGLVAILFCAAAWIGVQRLGYIEFNLASRLFHPRTFRRLLDAHIQLRALEDTLAAAATADQCWVAVRRAARDLGFNYVTLRLDHVLHEERFGSDSPYSGWTVNIPLSETEFVKLGQDFHNPVAPVVIAPFADLLRRTLEPKLPGFRAPEPVLVMRRAASAGD